MLVRGAARRAHVQRTRDQAPFIGTRRRAKQGAGNAESSTFVVYEAARTEFGDAQEARSLQEGLAPGPFARRRNVSHQRQAREIVSGQEAFSGEVSIRVKV